ncbi:hypothetical protein FJZ18_04325 [Candidatus Pacearchaeota archaeon]|nr:hypothetical protein [Candidatus Pacearchaeota archaeon]
MKRLSRRWLDELWSTRWKLVIIAVIGFLSIISNKAAGTYADSFISLPAPDIILDSIGPYDVTFLYVWFFLLVMYSLFLYPLIFTPGRFYYACGLIAFFTIVRSIFISLTHLYAPAQAISPVFPPTFSTIAYTNDLFFSGHTGLPFLGFLMFKNHWAKEFFLFSSIVLGASTLLMHQHYSIDVFAAFFITYGIYVMGNSIYKKIGWMPKDKS